MKKSILRMTAFITFFAIIFILVLGVLKPKYFQIPKNFYKQQKNTVDVLFLGSSNAYSNINPAVIWDNEGIASFNFCGSGQPVWNSYYYLKEAYKYQQPKLVVFEVNRTSYNSEYAQQSDVLINTAGLRVSKERIDSVKASVPEDKFLETLIGFPLYHLNYKDIFNKGIKEFMYEEERMGAVEKGFYSVNHYTQEFNKPNIDFSNRIEIPQKNEMFLRKLIELAHEKGSDVLLIKTPGLRTEYEEGVFNSITPLAEEYGVQYLNMSKVAEDMDFDYGIDLADTEHMRPSGVEKVSKYLSSFIAENYVVPDRRGDLKYASWEDYSQQNAKTHNFLCPVIISENIIFENNLPEALENFNGELGVKNYAIDIKKSTYYKISLEWDTAQDNGIFGVDFYGGEEYDNEEQQGVSKFKVAENKAEFVFYSGDQDVPKEVYLRLLTHIKSEVIVDRVMVWELVVDK